MKKLTIAVAGNPNCGKTTVFNGLTGSTAKVGNWPGVTVERKEGRMAFPGGTASVVDLPGIYSLSAESEDERVARDFLISGNVDLVVSIIDAANLERNLYLTATIRESGLPLVVVLNMMDVAEKRGLDLDLGKLENELGCPVFPLSAVNPEGLKAFREDLGDYLETITGEGRSASRKEFTIDYSPEIEDVLGQWAEDLEEASREMGVSSRFTGITLLEGDPFMREQAGGRIGLEVVDKAISGIETLHSSTADMVIADNRYQWISSLCRKAVKKRDSAKTPSRTKGGSFLDRIVLNRFLGIPVFIGVMYLVFWFTMAVGGAFIDFFDILFGGLFVDGLGALMERLGSPQVLITIVAGGIGGGIQTVSTFIPIIFVMFLMLSLLEDSGYMARAAFVMDRAMRLVGLPGKAFVPMLVGFGCTVPAIMATRTLESRRDRFLAIFMTPFMSCGARLPVYALFTAAFFGTRSGVVVFSLYMVGIVLAILTGVLLKHTLFKGTHSPFVMELPSYHRPRMGTVLNSAWQRLRVYIVRAGKVIVLVVLILSVLNSWGTDGTFGNEDSEESVLSAVGKAITPVFTPMGIEKENWPATVSLFTGLFAKEVVVGTLNALYIQAADETEASAEPWSLSGVLSEAFGSIGENLAGILGSVTDPFGFGIISGSEEATADELETPAPLFGHLRSQFSGVSAYAFLLFVLIYFPCVAALGAAFQETGTRYGLLLVSYLTLLGWIVSTLYYQLFEGGSLLWITVALLILGGIILSFYLMGRGRKRIEYPL